MFNSACPILPSSDFASTKAFYDRLGFTLTADYPAEGYLIFRRDSMELHFFHNANHVARTSDHAVYLRVSDASVVSDEFAALDLPDADIPRFMPAEPKPWGLNELVIVDPDGNLLRIGSFLADAAA